MRFQSRTRWLPAAFVAAAALAASGTPTGAQTREVPAESLIYDLKNPDPDRRQIAARQLGIAKHAPATPDLVALASDPVPSVRREAELSLEQMDDIRALPGFVQFTSDSEKDIRDRAVQALVNLHLPRSTGPASTLVKIGNFINAKDEDEDTVVEPDIPVDSVVVDALRARINDPEVQVRRDASRGLGILRAGAAIPDLVAAVREDRDNDVRVEAVRALRKIGEPSIGESITPLLNLNTDRVRNEIVSTVGYLRYRRAVSDLTKVFEQSKPLERSRRLALSALADIADPSSAPLFESYKADKNIMIRLYANEGLARIADPATKTALSGARLTEKNLRVQTAQAFGLLKMGQLEYMDELIRRLGNSTTRELAKEYLAETRSADRGLLFEKRSDKANVRADLAEVFGRIGDKTALPALQDLANDSNQDVSRAAERALRRINASGHGDD